MSKYIGTLIILVLMAFLTGCGEDAYTAAGASVIPVDPAAPPPLVPVGSVSLIAIPGSLGSASSDSVELSAIVKDINNVAMPDISVVFQASGGTLAVTSAKTSSAGIATATLTSLGDPTNRDITVTATAGTASTTATVTVSGTTVSVSGSNSLVFNDSTILTIFVKDSAGNGLSGQTVSVTSASGNTLSSASLTTQESGQAQVTVTGTVGGADTITVTALGAAAQLSINVSADQFSFDVPIANQDLDIGVNHTVTMSWSTAGAPVNGQVVNFTATRGTLSATSATTVAGKATVTISSNNAGPVDITASTNVSGGPTATISREFVATTPSSLVLQADKTTIGTNGKQAALTAIVRDASNNLVKNQTVRFSIFQDTTGGSISNSTDISDSQGSSTTIYSSTSTTSAKDGITIVAGLDGQNCGTPPTTNPLCDEINLTVAQSELFVVLGTGNKIFIQDETRYRYPYTVVVTDSAGNAVPNKDVIINLVPTFYRTGYLLWNDEFSTNFVITTDVCANEDRNLNGFIDVLPSPDFTEDRNLNGDLDPRNVASVSGTVTTDATGFAKIDIIYAKEYANWVSTQLTATTGVVGSESSDTVFLSLPAEAGEMSSKTNPPAFVSPWGPASTCYNVVSVVPYNVNAIASTVVNVVDPAVPDAGTDTTSITVTWTLLPQAISYNIYRDTNAIPVGNVPALTPIATGVSSPYTDTNLTVNTVYHYRVTAVFATGVLNANDRNVDFANDEGPASAEVFALTAPLPAPVP